MIAYSKRYPDRDPTVNYSMDQWEGKLYDVDLAAKDPQCSSRIWPFVQHVCMYVPLPLSLDDI